MNASPMNYLAVSGVGNVGETTLCRYFLALGSGASIATLESHSPSGEETDPIDRGVLAAHLFAPPPGGVILDVGVGDCDAALNALRLVARQDSNLAARLRIVTPVLHDSKSVAGLRWLVSQLPEGLRSSVRALWNRIRHEEESALKDSEIVRAARSVARQGGAQLCAVPLRESKLYDPTHPLVRRHGSIAALASLPDSTIREAPLSEMSTLLAARDAAQAAQANCREVYAAISADQSSMGGDGRGRGEAVPVDGAAALHAVAECLRHLARGYGLDPREQAACLAILEAGIAGVAAADLQAAVKVLQSQRRLADRQRTQASELSVRFAAAETV